MDHAEHRRPPQSRSPRSPTCRSCPTPSRSTPTAARSACCCCHGFTGSPASMRPWAEHLARRGLHRVGAAPAGPRHHLAGDEQHDAGTTGTPRRAGARRARRRLRPGRRRRAVDGRLPRAAAGRAARRRRRRPRAGQPVRRPAPQGRCRRCRCSSGSSARSTGIGNDIKKPGVDEVGYDRTPLQGPRLAASLWKLTRDDLPKVTAPLLLFRSADDHVVEPRRRRS